MDSEIQLPDPADLYDYLFTSIETLHENSEYLDGDWRLEEGLRNATSSLRTDTEDNWEINLDPFLVFNLQSDRDFPDGNGQARLGANIRVNDGEYEMFSSTLVIVFDTSDSNTQSLSHCCMNAESSDLQVLERIHWDIDTGSGDETKPICHLQVGGNLSPSAFTPDEDYHYCTNGLDKPRIPHPPMDPILILNLLIDQYHSLESFEQTRWTGIVRTGESILWEPYFTSAYGAVHDDVQIMDSFQSD